MTGLTLSHARRDGPPRRARRAPSARGPRARRRARPRGRRLGAAASCTSDARGTRSAAGTTRVERARRARAPGWSIRSVAVEVQAVEEAAAAAAPVPRRGAPRGSRSPGTGAGGRRARARSPRRPASTECTGSARTISTSSGSRAVTSSRLRVKSATSSPCAWICTRMPSSFHSTAARRRAARWPWPRPRRAAREHRRDAAGRPRAGGLERRRRRRQRGRRRPPAGRRPAAARVGRPRPARRRPSRSPRSARPRARPAAARRRSATAGSAAPARSRERTARAVSLARSAVEPAPATPSSAASAASTSCSVSVARVGGRRHAAEPAIADTRPPLARLADEVRQPDRRLGCVELRQAVGEPVALGETRGGGCDVLGRRDEVGEQQSLAGELGHGRPVGRDVDLEALAEGAHARPAQVGRDAVDPERGVDRDRARRPGRAPSRSRRAGTARRRQRPRPAVSTQRDTRPGTRFAGGRSRRSPRAGASRSARPR